MDRKLRKFLHLVIAFLLATSLVRAQVQQVVANSGTTSVAGITFTGRKALATNASSGASNTVTITSQVSGDTNIVGLFWCDDAGCDLNSTTSDTFTVTDGASNSYNYSSPDVNYNGVTFFREAVVHASNIATDASNTLTVSVSSTHTVYYLSISVSEFSGVVNSSPLDQTGTFETASGGSPSSVSTGSSTSQAQELVYGFFRIGTGTLAAGGCCTLLNSIGGTLKDEYFVSSSTGTQTVTMTYSGTTSQSQVVATYK